MVLNSWYVIVYKEAVEVASAVEASTAAADSKRRRIYCRVCKQRHWLRSRLSNGTPRVFPYAIQPCYGCCCCWLLDGIVPLHTTATRDNSRWSVAYYYCNQFGAASFQWPSAPTTTTPPSKYGTPNHRRVDGGCQTQVVCFHSLLQTHHRQL